MRSDEVEEQNLEAAAGNLGPLPALLPAALTRGLSYLPPPVDPSLVTSIPKVPR